ncbi:MAG: CHAP domain-containing protein [Oscillospiraceae bacterium]|nr:CHAP domain-containing protein [Oscillospiraceae bacterium]
MNLDREVVLTRKMVLFGVLAIVAALIFMAWFVVYRLEKDRVVLSEIPVSPTVQVATPDPNTVPPTMNAEVFDSNLDLGIDIITRLTDNDRTNDSITDSFARNNFLKTLASQVGSTGEIIGGGLSTFKYYTEWYVDGYPEDGSWNADTPWCASYISWCIEQVNLSIRSNIPRYANVDNFILHFWEETWLVPASTPTPGDLVFFGILNDPNHMGVVIAVEDGYIYTIEGNVNDVVGIRKYKQNDPGILGYGILNWAN